MKKRIYTQSDIKQRFKENHFRVKKCKYCQKEFTPLAPSHLFCSDICEDTSYTDSYFQNKYGLSFKEVQDLMEKQENTCAICKTAGFKMHPNSWSALNVDHSHVDGKVRGMLCHNCNRALGLFQDNIELLHNAVRYLESATTISQESTSKRTEAHDTQKG